VLTHVTTVYVVCYHYLSVDVTLRDAINFSRSTNSTLPVSATEE